MTKNGETRLYGSRPESRVIFPEMPVGGPAPTGIAVWPMDRVIDVWGNYFDVHYNGDLQTFATDGILVSKIEYTGHVAGSAVDETGTVPPQEDATDPFYSVEFTYQDRPDVRHVRFGNSTLPKKSRLQTIRVRAGIAALGSYSFSYLPNEIMLPSRLQSIQYCAEHSSNGTPIKGSCLDSLIFEWNGGSYSWQQMPHASDPNVGQENSFDLPYTLDPFQQDDQWHSRATQFTDLNGDGRPDFIVSAGTVERAWENNGHGWTQRDLWDLPTPLFNSSGFPIAVMADFDGDGLPDVIDVNAKVWLNRIKVTPSCGSSGAGPCWVVASGFTATKPADWPTANYNADKDLVADMDGDGHADLMHLGPHDYDIRVLLSTGAGWANPDPSIRNFAWNQTSPTGPLTKSGFRDFNRDGILDYLTSENLGKNGPNGSVWQSSYVTPDPNAGISSAATAYGDVDGDGLRDSVASLPYPDTRYLGTTAFATGYGFSTTGTDSYATSLDKYRPLIPVLDPLTSNEAFSMADINGDGLADIILNHCNLSNCTDRFDDGQLLVNTGSEWVDVNGATGRVTTGQPNKVPLVPTDFLNDGRLGAAFVDVDGDGITDLVQASSALGTRNTWLNKFQPPTIKSFPNGLARKTDVTYAVITTADAQKAISGGDADGETIYSSSGNLDPGTSYLAVPMRVVATVVAEDGTGTGATFSTSYQYRDLRASSIGRGPQGFARVIATDHLRQISTTADYAQVYPYSGLVTKVTRTALLGPDSSHRTNVTLSETSTSYCDNISFDPDAAPTCLRPMRGPGAAAPARTGQSGFVYPLQVEDKTYLRSSPVSQNQAEIVTTTTTTHYDIYNNPVRSIVTTVGATGDSYEKRIENTYGTSDSQEQRLGKVTQSVVKNTHVGSSDRVLVHTAKFEYGVVNRSYWPPERDSGRYLWFDEKDHRAEFRCSDPDGYGLLVRSVWECYSHDRMC